MFLKDSAIQLRFMEIVSNRAARQYLPSSTVSATPSDLSREMSRATGIEIGLLEKFFWGEIDSFDFETKKKFTIHLDLQADIFDLIIESLDHNVSKEIVIHSLEMVAENYLEPTECQGCAQIESLVFDSDLSVYRESDLYHLLLDLLDHVIDIGSPIKSHFKEDDLEPSTDPDKNNQSDLTPAMTAAFEAIPRSEQVEVLALLYKKISQPKEDSESLIEIEALSMLRGRYLSPLAKKVFDALASGPAIGLSSTDLIERLGLTNRRSLGQLERSVTNAIERLNEENIEHSLSNPLKSVTRGREKHYILDIETLENWRVILRAEQKSKTFI